MLGTRIITAIVLLAILLPALFAGSPWPFAAVTLVLIAAGGWEWGRLNGLAQPASLLMGGALAGLCLFTLLGPGLASLPAALWWVVGAAWVLGSSQALRLGPAGWPRLPLAGRVVLGFVLLWAAWAAIASARGLGLNFILSVFCLVWVADVFAYFGGRTLGRRKLAPAISPGKSWEGVWTGMAAVLLLGLAWTFALEPRIAADGPSLYARLLKGLGLPLGLLALVFLSAMSVVGDLFESLIKRAVGAKDSSQLLPGHGGVLDRVDALLPVFPLALALNSLVA
ncbi:phosphatidate cytidylyltransferase [Pelomonas sp. BJYL3]|uniref:phosphatidate cytidylyltransferase n=1 Tax=Pelomonas sp. BJYL3 TaxID=2976697 RepID=UPI0022B4B5A8|nr:phosphatidate cytidylyltransferase [Pelomonas sp. BJYL3]